MSIATNREDGGKLVRSAWMHWALRQPSPKPSWLISWFELDEDSREADRVIWDAISAPYVTEIAGLVDENARLNATIERLMVRLERYGH